MPRGDRTGPMGEGALTGRRAGYCAGYPAPGFQNPVPRLGLRRGFGGGGWGWRNQYYATGLYGWQRATFVAPDPEQEKLDLKSQADMLKNELEAITRRIQQLEEKGQKPKS